MKKPMVFEGILAVLIIVLFFAMYLMVTGSGVVETNDWNYVANGPYNNLQIGEDGTLYAFMGTTGNTVYAIDSVGSVRWKLQVPGRWRVANTFNEPSQVKDDGSWWSWSTGIRPVFSTDNGITYLYLRENRSTHWSHYPSDDYVPALNETPLEENLLAISPEGSILWNQPIGTDRSIYSDVDVKAANGRIHVFDNYGLTVLDASGATLFRIPDVSDPPAIDEDGRIYLVTSVSPSWPSEYYPTAGYRMPSATLRAYDADGALLWQENMSHPAWRQYLAASIKPEFGTLPIYQNNTLYMPVKNGIIALDTNGSVKWQKVYDWSVSSKLLKSMPMDSQGNVYLLNSRFNSNPSLEIINGSGLDVNRTEPLPAKYYTENDYVDGNLYNGNVYFINFSMKGIGQAGSWIGMYSSRQSIGLNLSDFFPDARSTNDSTLWSAIDVRLDAYNLLDGRTQWSAGIPVSGTNTVTIDGNNAAKYLPSSYSAVSYLPLDPTLKSLLDNRIYETQPGQLEPSSLELCLKGNILPGRDITYLSLYAAIGDEPIALSKSRWTYSSKLYAFNKNGTLIWEKPADYYVSSMAANNSTVFFNTADGKFNMASINGVVAGGITLMALVYVTIRFFLAGFVVRAKDRLGKNDKRNSILRFIDNNPGSTVFEISRGTGVNVGTVRYHVFILGINHRIVPYAADDKHVRYFTNSGAYSKDEKLVISLMRREGVGKILTFLMEKPGQTNIEISSALGIHESAVSRYMKELSEKGVVAREHMAGGANVYSLSGEHRDAIIGALQRPAT